MLVVNTRRISGSMATWSSNYSTWRQSAFVFVVLLCSILEEQFQGGGLAASFINRTLHSRDLLPNIWRMPLPLISRVPCLVPDALGQRYVTLAQNFSLNVRTSRRLRQNQCSNVSTHPTSSCCLQDGAETAGGLLVEVLWRRRAKRSLPYNRKASADLTGPW